MSCLLIGHWLSFPKLKTLVDQACISKRQCWRWKSSNSRVHQCHHLPQSIPNICKLLELKKTIAPTSSEAERSFSTMNRVKNPKRARLSNERTSDLTLLSHEKELTKAMDTSNIIDMFADTNCRVVLK